MLLVYVCSRFSAPSFYHLWSRSPCIPQQPQSVFEGGSPFKRLGHVQLVPFPMGIAAEVRIKPLPNARTQALHLAQGHRGLYFDAMKICQTHLIKFYMYMPLIRSRLVCCSKFGAINIFLGTFNHFHMLVNLLFMRLQV